MVILPVVRLVIGYSCPLAKPVGRLAKPVGRLAKPVGRLAKPVGRLAIGYSISHKALILNIFIGVES
jgi:hypothetical protein